MLKPSKKAGVAPFKDMGDAHGPSKHPARPNSPDSTKNRTIVSEAKGKGTRKTGTFTAPRSMASESDISRGYTKVG